MMPIHETIRPAIDKPLGCLNTPTNEKIKPSNHKIQLRTGTQHNTNPNKAKMKPAVPMPFFFTSVIILFFLMFVGLLP